MAVQAQLHQENLGLPLFGSQDWMIDISDNNNNFGGGFSFNQFCFNSQQKNHHHHHHHQDQILIQELQNLHHQKNDNKFWCYDTPPPPTTPLSMAYSQSIADQVEKQRQEIDQYVKLQNERLRLMLQEKRKQQMAALVKRIEPKLAALLREKDEEIARVAKRTMELEYLVRKLEGENQAWQRVAQEKEAMVVSLNNSLEQARENMANNGAEDAESCCDFAMEEEEEEEEEENREEKEQEKQCVNNNYNNSVMVCKVCNSRSSCVLLLPCRHLCSCKVCEAFLDSCPVCRTPKKARIEALIF